MTAGSGCARKSARAGAIIGSETRLCRRPAACRRRAIRNKARPFDPTRMEASQQITRKSASNLALAFILLPPEKRDEMAALYAFCREIDDVADDEQRTIQTRRIQLQQWRDDVRKACEGGTPEFPVNKELQLV